MEVENSVDSSKDAKHQLHLQKRREALRTKRAAETPLERTNRLAIESNKRKHKRIGEGSIYYVTEDLKCQTLLGTNSRRLFGHQHSKEL